MNKAGCCCIGKSYTAVEEDVRLHLPVVSALADSCTDSTDTEAVTG